MSNYQKGKIYKLVNDEMPDKIYYGSTTRDLNIRLSQHKSASNSCSSKILFEKGNVKIILVEEYPCYSKKQLEIKESFYIENNECINKVIPRKKPKKEFKCECGLTYTKDTKKEHFKSKKHIKAIQGLIEYKKLCKELGVDSEEE